MPRDDRAHGQHFTKKQKGGNKRRRPSMRRASGTRKTQGAKPSMRRASGTRKTQGAKPS